MCTLLTGVEEQQRGPCHLTQRQSDQRNQWQRLEPEQGLFVCLFVRLFCLLVLVLSISRIRQ